jgi:hypothetical protein
VLHSDICVSGNEPPARDPSNLTDGDNIIVIDVGEEPLVGTTLRDGLIPFGTVVKKEERPYTMVATKGRKGQKMVKRHYASPMAANGLPPLAANPRLNYTFRYKTTGDGGANVKISDLARSMVAAATANSFRYLFRTLKLNSVAIRAAPSNIGEGATVKLRFLGANTDETTYMDTSLRVDHNAYLMRKPPAFSLASFWHDVTSSTDDVAILSVATNTTGTADTYVDINLSVVFDESRYINYSISNAALSGLSPGGLYYGNLSESSPDFVPVGRKPLGL